MTKPPVPKKQQQGFQQRYTHTAVRFPPELHAAIKAQAELNGRSMNAEILERLEHNQIEELRKEVAELKVMLREVLDIVRDKL